MKARWNLLEARDYTTYIEELSLWRELIAEFKHALMHRAMDVRSKPFLVCMRRLPRFSVAPPSYFFRGVECVNWLFFVVFSCLGDASWSQCLDGFFGYELAMLVFR